jgi:uncharacterized protein YukE
VLSSWDEFTQGLKNNPTVKAIAGFFSDPLGSILSFFGSLGQTASGETVPSTGFNIDFSKVDFSQLEKDAKTSTENIKKIYNDMASSISKINLAIAKSWGKVVNKNTENAASGIGDIVSRFNKMASSISKINLAIAKSWSKTMNQNITNTVAAVKRINSELNKIKDRDVYVTTHHVDAFGGGGLMSFAKGGIIKAAGGLIETSHGPTTVMFGDNPGGREVHAFIPYNNPGPTMERLESMFGRVVSGNNDQPIVFNANFKIDGNEIINTRELHRTIARNMGKLRDRFG